MRHERRLRCTVPGSPTLRVCRRAFLISPLIVCHTLLRVCHSHLLCTRTSQPLPGNLSPLRLLCTRTLLSVHSKVPVSCFCAFRLIRLLLLCSRRSTWKLHAETWTQTGVFTQNLPLICSCALGGSSQQPAHQGARATFAAS